MNDDMTPEHRGLERYAESMEAEVRRLRGTLEEVREFAGRSIEEETMSPVYRNDRDGGWARHRDDLLNFIDEAARKALNEPEKRRNPS